MKKSLCMWLCIESEEDFQPSVVVAISSMILHIFDLKSLSFIHFVTDYLLKKSGFHLDVLNEYDVKIMINVSSYKEVKVNLYIDRNCEFDCSLREVISAYFKSSYRPSLDIVDVPDVLKLLSYFMTEYQMKLVGLQFNR